MRWSLCSCTQIPTIRTRQRVTVSKLKVLDRRAQNLHHTHDPRNKRDVSRVAALSLLGTMRPTTADTNLESLRNAPIPYFFLSKLPFAHTSTPSGVRSDAVGPSSGGDERAEQAWGQSGSTLSCREPGVGLSAMLHRPSTLLLTGAAVTGPHRCKKCNTRKSCGRSCSPKHDKFSIN